MIEKVVLTPEQMLIVRENLGDSTSRIRVNLLTQMVGAEGFEASFPSGHYAVFFVGFSGKTLLHSDLPAFSVLSLFPNFPIRRRHFARNWYHWYHSYFERLAPRRTHALGPDLSAPAEVFRAVQSDIAYSVHSLLPCAIPHLLACSRFYKSQVRRQITHGELADFFVCIDLTPCNTTLPAAFGAGLTERRTSSHNNSRMREPSPPKTQPKDCRIRPTLRSDLTGSPSN